MLLQKIKTSLQKPFNAKSFFEFKNIELKY